MELKMVNTGAKWSKLASPKADSQDLGVLTIDQ